jgi:hypothetical protein
VTEERVVVVMGVQERGRSAGMEEGSQVEK